MNQRSCLGLRACWHSPGSAWRLSAIHKHHSELMHQFYSVAFEVNTAARITYFNDENTYHMYAHKKHKEGSTRPKQKIIIFLFDAKKQHPFNILTVLSFKLSCPISFLSSAGSTTSPPMKSSILVCAALALILFRMPRRTEPIVSLVCDQISKSSTWRPWLGKRTINVMCFPRKALQEE